MRFLSRCFLSLGKLFGLRILYSESLCGDGFDALVFKGTVAVIGTDFSNLIYYIKAFDHLAECGIIAIKVGGCLMHYEELASGRVGNHGAGHGEHSGSMLKVILKTV